MRYTLFVLIIFTFFCVAAKAFSQEKIDPGEALYGEWEIVEMIFNATIQDLNGGPGGWFIFEKGRSKYIPDADPKTLDKARSDRKSNRLAMDPCVIGQGEIDFFDTPLNPNGPWRAIYKFEGNSLRLIQAREAGAARPTSFDDAVKNPRLTLFVLKKIK